MVREINGDPREHGNWAGKIEGGLGEHLARLEEALV